MIGTTRSRVNFFMNKFRDLGFIEYNGEITITHHFSASSFTINWLAVSRLGLAGPLANHSTQLVGLIMQLPHPLRLHCEIATDFRDLAFDCIRQFGGSAPRPSPQRAAYDFGLRHSIPS